MISAGDIRNNFQKLQSDLRSVHYPHPLNPHTLSLGDPAAFLPLLHHLFLAFSPSLTHYLSTQSFDLFGKKDRSFISCVYKICRDAFLYRPALTIEQFFSTGFAERKIMFVIDICVKCKTMLKDIERVKPKHLVHANPVQRIPLFTFSSTEINESDEEEVLSEEEKEEECNFCIDCF